MPDDNPSGGDEMIWWCVVSPIGEPHAWDLAEAPFEIAPHLAERGYTVRAFRLVPVPQEAPNG